MKILQTIPSMLASWGGPSTCTCDLLNGLYDIHIKADLLTSNSPNENELLLGKNKPWMKLVAYDWKTPLAFSNSFKQFLKNNIYDIYHINTIWLYPSHITCKIAREQGKPYIISPHGMLYPTALKINAWKKWPIKKIWFDKDIKQADCLHATCEQEMLYLRDFGYKGPIAVIPNPVVFPEGVHLKSQIPQKKKIGYLGRLHPIKKVENLLYAAAKVLDKKNTSFEIEIMGKGSDEYETFLKNEVKRLGLNNKVHFIGFVSGKEKYERLSNLWALFVPSEQENFGMIVPEALICGTPVYASLGTPWRQLNEYQCGWWKENTPESIACIITEILNKPENELFEMGKHGRELIESNYEQHKVALMMAALYEWLLGKQTKPDFVYE